MTNFTTTMMIAAATLVVAAGSASAQGLKAEIPFPFRAGGVVMAAGAYRVKVDTLRSGHPVFQIRSAGGGRSVLLVGATQRDPKKEWVAGGEAVLAFECGTGRCSLAEVWAGPGRSSYTTPRPKLGRDELTRTAVVVIRSEKGD
jgi:hypothetical protein